MNIAVTGATGFLGRYIVNRLTEAGHTCKCWHRPESDRDGFVHNDRIEWLPGQLNDAAAAESLVDSTDGVVHAALYRPGQSFRGGEGDLVEFVTLNVVGTVRLIEAARAAAVPRFVSISTCAVHEVVLDDRPLDEAHPLWARSHYGAHKAAVEKFIHSYGLGDGYDVCALRPTGIYGLNRPAERSKWYDLVHAVKAGKPIRSAAGGKEVHADDVAKAVQLLLTADGVAGQAYNCCDMYIAHQQVADIAKRITGSDSTIEHANKGPKHQIDTSKLRKLGMTFGGVKQLERTVSELLSH